MKSLLLFSAFCLACASLASGQQTVNRIKQSPLDGITIGETAAALVGFHGATPVAELVNALRAVLVTKGLAKGSS